MKTMVLAKFKYSDTHISIMLLNKIERVILQEVVKEKNRRIYGREIANKYKLNQKSVANALIRLEKGNILKYKTEGKNKYYFLNEFNPYIKEIVQISEVEKKYEFLKKNKVIEKLIREIEGQKSKIIILFGSYAKGTATKNSDLDLYVVGDFDKGNLEKDYRIKIQVVKSNEEKFDSRNPLIKEILENHIVLKGIEEFVDTWQR